MSGLFGGHTSTPAVPTATPVPTAVDTNAIAAAQASATAQANAAGRASTILTSGQGDTSAASIAKKTLLGGG